MDQPLKFNTGDRRIFSPAAHTVGWTVGRDRLWDETGRCLLNTAMSRHNN